MIIRALQKSDLPHINQLFIDTVHAINAQDYTQEQLDAWAPRGRSYERWKDRLKNHLVFVAEIDGVIAGFGDITTDGYLDHLFTHKDYQGKGVATALLAKLEEIARRLGLEKLTTEASITAKPFFEKRGFVVIRKQEKMHNAVKMINYKMHKILK